MTAKDSEAEMVNKKKITITNINRTCAVLIYFNFPFSLCHAIKNENANHSIEEVQNLGNERR